MTRRLVSRLANYLKLSEKTPNGGKMDTEKIVEDLGRAFEEFKKSNDARLKSIETKGYAPADLEEKVNKANDAVSKLEAELKSVQTAMARPGGQGETTETEAKKAEYKKAINAYLRKGNDTGIKTMSVDSDEDGGYLVTPEMSSEIVKKVYETSPMRQVASVQTISSDQLEIIEDLGEIEVGWVGETQARPDTDTAQLKKIIIPANEIYCQPLATQKLLDDANVNIEAWLGEKAADKFMRTENTAFVSGDGSGKPKGFLSYAAGTGYGQVEQVNSGNASALTPDGLISLCYSLKEAYKPGAVWLMKRSTVAEVRKLKDNQNRYLWEPGLNGPGQSMLMGFSLYEADDMPAVGAGNLAIAFGNFKAGYQIVDRIGIRVIRDVFTAKPYVKFYMTKRVGGAVKNFEAIKLQKISA